MGGEKKQKKKKQKGRKRKRDHHHDAGANDDDDDGSGGSDVESQQESGRSDQVSRRKHKKKSHKDKSKKRDKGPSKHSPVPEEVLTAVGLLSDDNYFEKHAEFATWLLEKQGKYFNDLPSEDTRAQFSKFVQAWNARSLEMKYYEGIDNAPTRRTHHKWGLKGKDKDGSSGDIYSKGSRKEQLYRTRESEHGRKGPEASNEKVSKLSERLGFRMSSFCPPKEDDSETQAKWRKETLPFTSEMKQAGENAAARMFDGGFAKDTSDLSHFHSLVNSSTSLKIRKRDVTEGS